MAHHDIVFAKVDTDAKSGLASAMGIRSIPTLKVLLEGVMVFSQPGALPAEAFEELISKGRDLDFDMEQVHRGPRGEDDALTLSSPDQCWVPGSVA